MTELLPTRQAADLRRAITDYVTTAISLADPSVATALDAFLEDEDSGIFLGPYLRTRLPFAAGAGEQEARRLVPSLPEGFTPYAHQAQAFSRLTTVADVPGEQDELGFRLPQPTIVTTGTGSGKTESFLYPMLDHVARARGAGVGGMKALILYPMNALANDQAGRLAKAITENSAYQGISAALYTGEASANPSTVVSADGLITDREMIRGSVPDIVLTNYKMLDQLLLRRADRPLWDASGASLRYLVLDEFHTYDGAQGTDVGMLLRRLSMVLETAAPGRVHLTPVATSATLGDGADAADAMLEFADTVFGTEIGPDAVITESRVPLDEFVAPAQRAVDAAGAGDQPLLVPSTLVDAAMNRATAPHLIPGIDLDADALTRDVLDALWRSETDLDASASELAARHGLGPRDLLLAHPRVVNLLQGTSRAVDLHELARALFPAVTNDQAAEEFTTALLAVISHERARAGAPRNSFPNLEAHLWLREITRVDRVVAAAPSFRWSDAVAEDGDLALPAIYCRHCGRSGWGATTRAVGDDLDLTPDRIRKDAAERNGRFRALILDISTPDEAADRTSAEASRRRHLNLDSATLDLHGPTADDCDSSTIRVLAHASLDADQQSIAQACPACEEKDAIRFLGTRLATLLSVSLTSLFGTPGLDLQEKKALVFVDSVQDAAHRAGFVESRSHALTFRSVIHSALTEQPEPLEEIVQRMLEAATTDEQRYRLLHPTITDSERLAGFWHQDQSRRRGHPAAQRRRAEALVRSRLQFDLGLEMGLTGQVGRTLLLTGSAQAQVRTTDGELDQLAERVLGEIPLLLGEESIQQECDARRRWIRGVLERLRTRGAISHPWLEAFRKDGGPLFRLWGGRPEQDVMPAFPSGRALPQLPSIGTRGKKCEFDDATGRTSWYADWTARALSRDRGVASTFVRPLLEALTELNILDAVEAKGTAPLRSFALRPERIEACLPTADASGKTPSLTCDDCRDTVTGAAASLAQLSGGPCLRHRCTGRLRPHSIDATYYRSLYQGDMRRVVAREHTSLLTTEDRLEYETSFKTSAETPGSPNVLVATPTLEMGIDIGDLSTVLLASVPRTVASYLQRVGRAGRKTGNALDVTFVAGRGRTAGVFYDPLDLLNGNVRAPGAYLSAEEILRRQFLASLMDTLAGDDRITPPGRTTPVLATAAPGSFLGNVLAEMDARGSAHVDRFLDRFAIGTHSWDGLTEHAAEALRSWAVPQDGGSSELAATVHRAVERWTASREELRRRRARIQENLDKLEAVPSTEERDQARAALQAEDLLISAEQETIGADPALSDEERETERRRLRGSAGRVGAEVSALDSAHWIGVLELYGLLPNFTLVDDAVNLEATVIWQDEDGRWQHEAASYARSGTAALTELAPGAHFYAHGRELQIDAVDIGVGGNGLQPTAFCPRCGHVISFDRGAPPASCPACGGREIADSGQHRDVVDLTRVYSTMSRNRTRISDSDDDRQKIRFETALSASFHGAVPLQRWSVVGSGFGMSLDRGTTLTRLNLGRSHQVADKIRLSGQDITAPGFLVCARCGHQDTDTAGNHPQDHQAWCDLRYERDGENRAALLSRTMRTETVLITLPPEILEDPTEALLLNLTAAIQLGIETRFGGSIGNLELDVIAHPTHSGHRALLISDTIVGGTGYLMELATANSVWNLLVEALHALEQCPCREEGLAACHRCLLPYVRVDAYEDMRRTVAIEALQILLATETPQLDAMTWAVEEKQADVTGGSESPLEQRFRRAFLAAMQEIEDASVSLTGSAITVRRDGRVFTLSSQVDIAGSRPDFVLTWQGSDVEGIAIFTDGRAFHAAPGVNRVADDAVKRMRLRRAGYLPLMVTDADLHEDSARQRSEDEGVHGALPALLVPPTVDRWAASNRTTRDLAALLRATPLDLLLDVVRTGSTRRLQQVATELPQLLVSPGGGTSITTVAPDQAEEIAEGLLLGRDLPPFSDPTRLAVGRRDDELAALGLLGTGERQLILVLDDRDAALRRDSFADAWRQWGRLANLAQGDPYGSTVRLTTMRLLEAGIDVSIDASGPTAGRDPGQELSAAANQPVGGRQSAPSAPEAVPEQTGVSASSPADEVRAGKSPSAEMSGPSANLSPAWQAAYDDAFTEAERQIIALAAQLGFDVPVVGEEFGSGVPLDLAWPDLKAAIVTEDLDERARGDLENEGWTIIRYGTDGAREALEKVGGSAP